MLSASEADKQTARTRKVDSLTVSTYATESDMAAAVARVAQAHLIEVLQAKKTAAVILATGNSQIRFLDALIKLGGFDWSRLTLFHMDEYLGLPANHSASFRRYMRERVELKVKPKAFHYLEGDAMEPIKECDRYTALLSAQPIDLCCLGIGENGHIAFNDPPVADFKDPRQVKIVKLDMACRQQQVGEGHFPNLDAVPQYALTLTIPMLCSAGRMLCIAPEKRKAKAVREALEGPISAACPASFLRRQPQATLFLDGDSSALLKGK